MFDALFVAREQFKRSVGPQPDASKLRALSAAAGSPVGAPRSTSSVFRISELAQRTGELNRQLDRIELAHRLVRTAETAARSIASALGRAKIVAEGIEPSGAQDAALTTADGATSSAPAATEPVSATGTALLSSPVTILGSISLAADVAAGGSGDLVLGPVSHTGSQQLLADAVASATGTQDVASSSNLLLDTSLSQSQTLTIDAGNGVETIVFGVLGGQVNSASALEQAIDAIDGVEAAYTPDGYLEITGTDADTPFTVGGTADIQSAFGIAEQAYDPFNVLDQGIAQSETLVFQVGADPAETITFGTGGGEVSTLAELGAALAGLTGVTASLDGNNRVIFTADTATDAVSVSGSAGALASLGLEAKTYDPNNLLLQGIASGETLTFQLEGEALQTITFGTEGGEVSTVAELDAALADLTGITAAIDGQNRLSFTADDAKLSVTAGGTADVSGILGVAEQAYEPFNLLDQGLAQGQTFTVTVAGAPVQTITFGTGEDEVGTRAGLATALSSLTGLTGSLDGQNRISLTGADAEDTIAVGGTADVAGALGIAAQSYAPTNLLHNGLAEGETLTFQLNGGTVQTITFGTGAGDVDTLAELDAALQSLTGLTAKLEGGNTLTFTAGTVTDTVTVAGTADVEQVFGIVEKTFSQSSTVTASPSVYGAATPAVQPVSDADSASLAQLNGDLAEIATLISDARLIDGFTHLVRFSARAGDEVTVGGRDLSLAGLGLKSVDQSTFASQASKAELIGKLDAAATQIDDAIASLKAESGLLAARSDFAADITALIDETSDALTVAKVDLKRARQIAIETRKLLGRSKIKSALSAGAVSEIGRPASVILNQLVGSAFSGNGGALFTPLEFTSSPAFQRIVGGS